MAAMAATATMAAVGAGSFAPSARAVERTIEEAWHAHERPLFRHLLSLTRDEATAEDLTQEAFLRLTREVAEGRPPENPRGWLFAVAGNLVTSRGRRRQVADRHAPVLAARELDRVERSPEDVVTERERDEGLAAALAGLRETDREIILLAAYGYRGPEIAERIGRTQAATRTLLCRARIRLRERLVLAGVGA